MFRKILGFFKNRKEEKLLKEYDKSFLKDLMNFEDYKYLMGNK